MMKYLFILVTVTCAIPGISFSQSSDLMFTSTDTAIENTFRWAKEMALSYVGKSTDPVGAWYEAALPGRSAFCMRDVSHQSLAAAILGLARENKNMFSLFAKNISDEKDWCTYWEIDKWGNPAPADYRNDKEFWYNLPANFDLITALWKLYLWTGDRDYIDSNIFKNFYEKSLNDYVTRWVLSPDSLMSRPSHPNAPVPFDATDPFHFARGLPSYVEGVADMKMGVDLIAGIYRAILSYSSMLRLRGNPALADEYAQRANTYQSTMDKNWWNTTDSSYYAYYSSDHKFGLNEGNQFLIWFDAVKDNLRKHKTIEHLLRSKMNVESNSYMPLILYANGYWDHAYADLLFLSNPNTERRIYPEVSFGILEGIVQGLMGVDADARTQAISTIYRMKNGAASSLRKVPVFNTTIDVDHQNRQQSSLKNNGTTNMNWHAMFVGKYKKAGVGSKVFLLRNIKDENSLDISYLDLKVKPGEKINIRVY